MGDVVTDRLAELKALVGLDVDAQPQDPTLEETTAWLTEQAATVIDRVTPAKFRKPIPMDARVQMWVNEFIANPSGASSLLLVGGTGTGKTHQAYMAWKAATLGAYARNIRPVYRAVNHPNLIAATRPAANDSHIETLRRFANAGLLLLDDLGAEEKPTEWSVTTLYRLVNHRWEYNLPTIWTTNRAPEELEPLIGDRTLSRIWESRRVSLTGRDRRKEAS
jgi:DNA replication protein DnaC